MSYQHPSAKIPYDLDIWVVSLPSNRGKWRFSSGSPSLKMVPRDHDFDHMMQEAQEDLLSVSKFFGGPCDLWYIQKRTNTSLIHVVFFDIFCKYFLFDYTSIICITFVYTSDLFIILQRCWMFFFVWRGDHQIFTSWTSNFNFGAEAERPASARLGRWNWGYFMGKMVGVPRDGTLAVWPPSRSHLKGDISPINTNFLRLYIRGW